jgi:cbb3-type cytochrome oxidase subunit 3
MTDINFKELWQNQKTDSNIETIIQKSKVENKKIRNKIIIQSLILVATAIYIIGIIYYFQPEMMTTKIGAILTILAIAIQLIANKNLIKKTYNFENSNADFLNNLLIFKKHQEISHTKILSIYYVLLSLGILLYMIEYAIRMELIWAIVTYALTIIWFAIGWFYFRPRQIKKQNQKINSIIENLENIKNQFPE